MLNSAQTSATSIHAFADRLCRTLDSSGSCFIIVDDQLRLCAANSVGDALLEIGWAGEALSEARSPELVNAVRRVLSTGRGLQLELRSFPHSGLHGCWDVECVPLLRQDLAPMSTNSRASGVIADDAVAGVLLVLRDDGERQALRRELERANRTESLGRLAGSIAHDFNNLLTGIRGSIALARQNRSVESHDGALKAADLAAQRAAQMTRQLLTFNRGPAYVPARAEAKSVLQEAADLVSCLPDGAALELDLSDDLGRADVTAAELHQIALNLLMNARDAVKRRRTAGRVRLSAERSLISAASANETDSLGVRAEDRESGPVRLSGERSARWLKVTVSDNGPGMDASTRKRLFEPFFTTKTGQEASGLGLSSVRDIVERAGGWIEVQSELEQGATFSVYLPLLSEGLDMNLEPAEQPVKKRDQVLICDDESRLATLTAGLLKEFGYGSTAVGAGEEALNVMRAHAGDVDVLLLDVNLTSGTTAHDILETMRREGLDSPVILTSGFAPEDVPESLRHHHCVASYLPKPYTVGELVAAIKRALQRKNEAK